jgi:hypothetical protein
MGQGIKLIAGGFALFVLGGAVVYFISQPNAATTQPTTQAQTEPAPTATTTSTSDASAATATPTESFYAAAEARREQVLINKEENDRLAKLKATKERSVECKFWKQQQKTSSAAAKIEEKINEHCNLPSSSAASSSSTASDSASSGSATTE